MRISDWSSDVCSSDLQQIALLEDDLGVRLLTRGARGVQPTPEGTLLYRHAQTILRQVDTTRSLLAKNDTQIAGTVSIGLASSTARMIALPLMKDRKSVVSGKSVSVRVDLGVRRIINKKQK